MDPMISSKSRKAKTASLPKKQVSAVKGAQPIAKAFVAQTRPKRYVEPKIRMGTEGDCLISHSEYFNELSGSVNFASNSYAINPGLSSLFPWLSAIASRYESYVFEKLCFEFATESPTTRTGTVLMVVDYDASDSAPTTKSQALAYRSMERSAPWVGSELTCDREDLRLLKSYKVRSGDLSSNQDIKLYDTGNFFPCTQGQADTSVVGELYVHYKVRLISPQLGPVGENLSLWAQFSGTSNSAPAGTKIGNLPASASSTGTTTSVTTFTFTQPWRGLISTNIAGTGLTGVAVGGTATTAEAVELINAGATVLLEIATVTADIGQTVTYTISNTTITSDSIRFSQGAF